MNGTFSGSVFLGVPAVLTKKQQSNLDQWLEWLKSQAMEIVRLERNAYSQEPWRGLMKRLSNVDGVVLLGFHQLYVQSATWRSNTREETYIAGCWTSPWLHLEAGMAVALGLPVLVACDEGVEEGVFSPNVWGSQVRGTALASPGKAGVEWLRLVRSYRIMRKQGIFQTGASLQTIGSG
jgi:hypothetical protein